MTVFVALLRGVNVGRANRLPMAGLRTLLGALGYGDVVTALNSGNAVFRAAGGTPARHAAAIAAQIAARLGLAVPVIVKSARAWATIVEENPLAGAAENPSRLLVTVAQDRRALAALSALQPLLAPTESLHLGRHAAYLNCPSGLLDSKAGAALFGGIGRAVTTRNWATVLRLQALTRAGEG